MGLESAAQGIFLLDVYCFSTIMSADISFLYFSGWITRLSEGVPGQPAVDRLNCKIHMAEGREGVQAAYTSTLYWRRPDRLEKRDPVRV